MALVVATGSGQSQAATILVVDFNQAFAHATHSMDARGNDQKELTSSGYTQDGVKVTAPGFVWSPTGTVGTIANNGTPFLALPDRQTATVAMAGGAKFALVSVDLAEYSSSLAAPITVYFSADTASGLTLSRSMTLDGILTGAATDFQTHAFPAEWTDLTELRINGPAFDNLRLIAVPEPSVLSLSVGLFSFALRRRRGSPSSQRSGQNA